MHPRFDADSVVSFVNSAHAHGRNRFIALRHELIATAQPGDKPLHLLPGFLFGLATFDDTTVALIESTFKRGLEDNGIHTDFTLNVVPGDKFTEPLSPDSTFKRVHILPRRLEPPATKGLSIRPILLDPEGNRFITVAFHQPWQYVLNSLSWQLVISVVLVATFIGCFIYLFQTVFKQNRLALLRKTFVNNMTHELRTPVATVSAAVQALQHYTDLKDYERRDKYLAISKEELDHLATMIDRVLQVEEGDTLAIKKLNCQHIDLSGIIQRCVEKAYINYRNKPVTFSFDPPHEGATIYGDGEHMRNVVSNLLDNAVKYGATLVSISLQYIKHADTLALQVHDNGIGIPKIYHNQIFEPFFRVPDGDLHRAKGSGIGLSYVKQVVAQHKGTVAVRSEPGKGSCFTLTLPRKGYDN